MAKDEKDILLFQTRRAFTTLCKHFLHLLEDLQREHQINFDKLHNSLGSKYTDLIEMADYFSDEKYTFLRKRVFDAGGELNREMETEIMKYNFHLENENNRG